MRSKGGCHNANPLGKVTEMLENIEEYEEVYICSLYMCVHIYIYVYIYIFSIL